MPPPPAAPPGRALSGTAEGRPAGPNRARTFRASAAPRLPMPSPRLNPEPGRRPAKVTWRTSADGRNLSAIRVRLEHTDPLSGCAAPGPFPSGPTSRSWSRPLSPGREFPGLHGTRSIYLASLLFLTSSRWSCPRPAPFLPLPSQLWARGRPGSYASPSTSARHLGHSLGTVSWVPAILKMGTRELQTIFSPT